VQENGRTADHWLAEEESVMADDERRAEIEAVARAIRDFAPMCDSMAAAQAARTALDRVRDARGDDEPQYSTGEFAKCYVPWDEGGHHGDHD
jgi:hypothetical protein